MGFYLARFGGQAIGGTFEDGVLAGGRPVAQTGVRVGDGGLLDVFVDGLSAFAVGALQVDLDDGAVGEIDVGRFVADYFGAVLFGVDRHPVVVGLAPGSGAGGDVNGAPGGQQAVHAGGADADALLATGHLEAVKLRAVEQLAEDVGDLLGDDSGAVIGDAYAEAMLVELVDANVDVGQDAGLFAGIEAIVDGLLDGVKQCLSAVVESEQVSVLGEELGDGDVPLPACEAFGNGVIDGPGKSRLG